MSIIRKIRSEIQKRVDRRIGTYLRSRYQSFKVTCPYVIEVNERQSLKGKVAVVTGGSGAIGRACCFRLAAEGATVYVCGTRLTRIEIVVNEIITAGFIAHPQVLNVSNYEEILSVFSQIYAREGSLDILVNSAGGSARDRADNLVDQDVNVIDEILSINLRGAMLCAKEAAKNMIPVRSGKIVNITSVIGLQGKAGFSEYAASKAGSIVFAKSLAMELGKFNINVNCVSPGIVQRGEVSRDMIENLSKTNFMNAYGKPEDISNAVNFLCSNEASFITGQNLVVDGGRSLGLKEQ